MCLRLIFNKLVCASCRNSAGEIFSYVVVSAVMITMRFILVMPPQVKVGQVKTWQKSRS
jgi:hypothetical protein